MTQRPEWLLSLERMLERTSSRQRVASSPCRSECGTRPRQPDGCGACRAATSRKQSLTEPRYSIRVALSATRTRNMPNQASGELCSSEFSPRGCTAERTRHTAESRPLLLFSLDLSETRHPPSICSFLSSFFSFWLLDCGHTYLLLLLWLVDRRVRHSRVHSFF